MIRQASVYDKANGGGLRVLIMRYWPRGVRRERIDVWLKEAAPSKDLLQAYGQGKVDWGEFEQRYRAEMREKPEVLERLRELEREHGVLTLLCWERDAHCHRYVLAELLRSNSRNASP